MASLRAIPLGMRQLEIYGVFVALCDIEQEILEQGP